MPVLTIGRVVASPTIDPELQAKAKSTLASAADCFLSSLPSTPF